MRHDAQHGAIQTDLASREGGAGGGEFARARACEHGLVPEVRPCESALHIEGASPTKPPLNRDNAGGPEDCGFCGLRAATDASGVGNSVVTPVHHLERNVSAKEARVQMKDKVTKR